MCGSRPKFAAWCATALSVLSPQSSAPALAEDVREVYLTRDQALALAFPNGETPRPLRRVMTPEEKKTVQERYGSPVREDGFIVWVGTKDGKVTGYAIITDEIGKTWIAWGLSPAPVAPDPTEIIAVVRVPFLDLLDEIGRGTVRDSLTVATAYKAYHMAQNGALPPALAQAMLGRV